MEEIEQFVLTSDEENLTFTKKQIEYLPFVGSLQVLKDQILSIFYDFC